MEDTRSSGTAQRRGPHSRDLGSLTSGKRQGARESVTAMCYNLKVIWRSKTDSNIQYQRRLWLYTVPPTVDYNTLTSHLPTRTRVRTSLSPHEVDEVCGDSLCA